MIKSINFTTKYLFALFILACLSFLAYLNLTTLIEQQSNDSKIINLSGKQRMLSQKIYNSTMVYNLDELKSDILAMEKTHNYLTSLKMSEQLKKLYFEKPYYLDNKIKEFIKRGKNIKKYIKDNNSNYILENKASLLKNFDMLTTIYQKESELKIKKLKQYEQYILIFSMIILVLVGFFIFRPANRVFEEREKEIIDERNYSNIIIESNTNAIIVVGSDLKVKTFNKTAEKIFGYTKEEMIGKNSLQKLVPLLSREDHNIGILNHFKTNKFKHNGENLELEALRKNGETFPIRISFGKNEYNENNEKIVIANIQDMSVEKEKDKLIFQQSKMAAMGEMIENIAHQWRQPLSIILTASSGIKFKNEMNVIREGDIEVAMDGINNSVQYLSQTIDNFRDFFKTNRKKTYFNLKETFKKTFKLIASQLDNTEIVIVKNIKNATLLGYEHELVQVLITILNNARDELIEKEEKVKLILIDTKIEENILEISIKDNAGGVPADIIGVIFTPRFTTTKEYSKGRGTGLYMSKMIIEEHIKGTIEVENKEFIYDDISYVGAEFKISLPIIKE